MRAMEALVPSASMPFRFALRERSRSRSGESFLLGAIGSGSLYGGRALGARIRRVWIQRRITLGSRPRGFHLVTDEIVGGVPELRELRVGIATVFMQHTSASLTLNENASPDVRRDFAAWFDRAVPDGAQYFAHTLEGPDDMPAHLKSSLTDSSLVLPVADGRLALGTWQGIYLCEHRDHGGPRRVVVTAFGEASS
jgi:secondary thiamine-phosphate synthase enzyme